MKPPYLYKYLSLNSEYVERTLSDAALWFGRPGDFNDPFDCQAFFRFDSGTDEQRSEMYEESITTLVENDERFTEARVHELIREYKTKYPTLEIAGRIVLQDELYKRANLSNLGVCCV